MQVNCTGKGGSYLRLEAVEPAPDITFGDIIHGLDLTGKETTAQRRVRDQRNIQLLRRRRHAVRQQVGGPERELDFHQAEGVDGVRLLDGLRASLADADAADLAGRHQLPERAQRLLERDVRVYTGRAEDVDLLGAAEVLDAGVGAGDDLVVLDGRAHGLEVDAALDEERHLARVLRVRLEVAPDEGQPGRRLRHPVVVAAGPEGGALRDGLLHRREGLRVRRVLGPPGHAHEPEARGALGLEDGAGGWRHGCRF